MIQAAVRLETLTARLEARRLEKAAERAARVTANQQVVQLHEATTTGGGVALPPAGRPTVIDEGASATPVAAVRASSSVLRGTRPSAQGLIPEGLDQLSPLLVGADEQARPAAQSVTPVQLAASDDGSPHDIVRAGEPAVAGGQSALPVPAGELLADAIKRVAVNAAAVITATAFSPPLRRSWSRNG